MSRTRCLILANHIPGFQPAGLIMRCPTGLYQTHYHAATVTSSPLSRSIPCAHRHQSVNSAITCAESLRTARTAPVATGVRA